MRLFIANRGEIAHRILRTARKLGYEVVVPYVPRERGGIVCELADETKLIPPGGFLNGELLVSLAQETQCEFLHPGYGFLSERADFASAVEEAGIRFVGPTPESMRELGEKSLCRARAKLLGIPVSEGYEGDAQSEDVLLAEGKRIGFPLLVKAAAGGGGRGMRKVHHEDELPDAIRSARREAESGFGDGKLLLERFFENGRHIEVQVVGDGTGACAHLYERDCTIQRRYQKLLEEAPAIDLPGELRSELADAALKLVSSVKLRGVSTVEFLVDVKRGAFIFLEVNTRLQVEHPVTEEILGLDLVELQLRIARGELLSACLPTIQPNGHAIEVRIVAENPYEHFLPSMGTVVDIRYPRAARIEQALRAGEMVSGDFDSLIAKLITVGESRADAIRRMQEALLEFRCVGIETNVPFLHEVLSCSEFQAGNLSSLIVSSALARLGKRDDAVYLAREGVRRSLESRFARGVGFRISPSSIQRSELYRVEVRNEIVEIVVQLIGASENGFVVEIDGERSVITESEGHEPFRSEFVVQHELVRVQRVYPKPQRGMGPGGLVFEEILAPLPGKILRIGVVSGQTVTEGQVVATLESMKMEHQVKASVAGVVEEIFAKEGSVVGAKAQLLKLRVAH